jgi:hypothetical protein
LPEVWPADQPLAEALFHENGKYDAARAPPRMTTYTWSGVVSGLWESAADWTPSGGPPGLSDTAIIANSDTISGTGSVAGLDTTNGSGIVTLAGIFNIGTIFNGDTLALTGSITTTFIETFADLEITSSISAVGNSNLTYEGIIQHNGLVNIENGATVNTSQYLIAYSGGALNQPNTNQLVVGDGSFLDITTTATVDASNQVVGGLDITVAASVLADDGAVVPTPFLELEDPDAIMVVDDADLQVLQTSTDPSGVAGINILAGALEIENLGGLLATFIDLSGSPDSSFTVDDSTATIAAPSNTINGISIRDGDVAFNDSTITATQLFMGPPTDTGDTTSPTLSISSSTLDIIFNQFEHARYHRHRGRTRLVVLGSLAHGWNNDDRRSVERFDPDI